MCLITHTGVFVTNDNGCAHCSNCGACIGRYSVAIHNWLCDPVEMDNEELEIGYAETGCAA